MEEDRKARIKWVEQQRELMAASEGEFAERQMQLEQEALLRTKVEDAKQQLKEAKNARKKAELEMTKEIARVEREERGSSAAVCLSD